MTTVRRIKRVQRIMQILEDIIPKITERDYLLSAKRLKAHTEIIFWEACQKSSQSMKSPVSKEVPSHVIEAREMLGHYPDALRESDEFVSWAWIRKGNGEKASPKEYEKYKRENYRSPEENLAEINEFYEKAKEYQRKNNHHNPGGYSSSAVVHDKIDPSAQTPSTPIPAPKKKPFDALAEIKRKQRRRRPVV